VKSCKKCCISNAVDETDTDMFWNGSQEEGNIRVSVRKTNALVVKKETAKLIGKGR